MKTLKFLLPLALLATTTVSLTGCIGSSNGDQDQVISTKAADAHAAEPDKITSLTSSTELFLELPPLVAGQPATLAAHLTQLADFKPVANGAVEVVLAGGNAQEQRFAVDAPSAPGLFKLVITPKQAGEPELTLILKNAQREVRHELGPITVYTSAAEAAKAHAGHDHHDEGIVFTKEQQWKVDFATAAAAKGIARTSVIGNGVLRSHPDGEAQLTAPAGGQLNSAGRFPYVGMPVKRGQILAYLAPKLGGDTDHAALEANAAKARIAHAQAKRERERVEALLAQEAVPEKRVFAARADEQMAAAELDAATRRLGQYGGGQGGIAVRAPIDGLVADVKVAPGGFADEGALLFHIADTRRLWLEVRVPESEASKLGQPSGGWFTHDGDEHEHDFEVGRDAKLIAVGAVVDPSTRTVPVIFEFPNPGETLRIGQSVKARVRAAVANTEALMIPASALQDENGTPTVYVQTGGESFERRVVTPGVRDGDRVEIKSGLEAGQRVVAKGAYLVRLAATKSETAGHGHAH